MISFSVSDIKRWYEVILELNAARKCHKSGALRLLTAGKPVLGALLSLC